MTLEFLDMEQSSNPLNGTKIRDKAALLKLLNGLRNREPFLFELSGDNGYKLIIGIAGNIGCVQHSPNDGNTPYLMAVCRDEKDSCDGDEEVEFLAGGTPTPIARDQCISFELLKQVAVHFLETGERSSAVSWEEI